MTKATCSQLRLKLQEIKTLKKEFDLGIEKIREKRNTDDLKKASEQISEKMEAIDPWQVEKRRKIMKDHVGYDWISSFTGGVAIAKYMHRYRYIDERGECLSNDVAYLKEASEFVDGMARIYVDGQGYNFIDEKGRKISEKTFKSVKDFSEGLARVQDDEGYFFIDKQGEDVSGERYTDACSFLNGNAVVAKNREEGFLIDKSGNRVNEGVFPGNSIVPAGGGYYNFLPKHGNIVLVSIEGKKIFECDGFFNYIGNDLIAVSELKGNDNFIINNKGERINRTTFDRIYPMRAGLIKVEKSGDVFFLNHDGQTIASEFYMDATDFSGGLCSVRTAEGWKFIDKDGKSAFSKEQFFQKADEFSCGLALVKKDGNYFFIDKAGNRINYETYENAHGFGNGLAPVKIGRKWIYINKLGEQAFAGEYSNAGGFRHGMALVNNEYYIDKKGRKVFKGP